MNFFLKILNASKSHASLRVNGYSGILFLFKWDAQERAYTYQPKNQKEVDDLYKTMGRTTSYVFVPVNREVVSIKPDAPVPEIKEPVTLEAGNPPLNDKLTEGALLRGVVVTDEDTNETATRLIAAYDKGAQDALNNLTKSKKQKSKV